MSDEVRDHFPRCRVPPNKATLSGYHRNVGDSSIENVEVAGEVRHKCHTQLSLRLRTNQATARACSSSLRLTKFELAAASSLLRQRQCPWAIARGYRALSFYVGAQTLGGQFSRDSNRLMLQMTAG